jgi:5'-nucleotidase
MNILLTNDDGIQAPGLLAAYRALTARGHRVTACAPEREMSYRSQSVTIGSPLSAREVPMPDSAAGYAVSGTPADCARLGFTVLAPKPDLVLSGINSDTNLGYDANYSGTVAAALEAAGAGWPALAASLERSAGQKWDLAAEIVVRAAEAHASWAVGPGIIVSLNIPTEISDPRWVWAPVNPVPVPDSYRTDEAGRYVRVRREDECPALPGTDLDWCRRGRVTLTPLSAVTSDLSVLARLQAGNPL